MPKRRSTDTEDDSSWDGQQISFREVDNIREDETIYSAGADTRRYRGLASRYPYSFPDNPEDLNWQTNIGYAQTLIENNFYNMEMLMKERNILELGPIYTRYKKLFSNKSQLDNVLDLVHCMQNTDRRKYLMSFAGYCKNSLKRTDHTNDIHRLLGGHPNETRQVLWDHACGDQPNNKHVLSIKGPPGTGKSAIIHALTAPFYNGYVTTRELSNGGDFWLEGCRRVSNMIFEEPIVGIIPALTLLPVLSGQPSKVARKNQQPTTMVTANVWFSTNYPDYGMVSTISVKFIYKLILILLTGTTTFCNGSGFFKKGEYDHLFRQVDSKFSSMS